MDSHGGELGAGSESQAEDAGQDEPEPKRPVRFPASMGLSVYLPRGKDDGLDVEVRYADYDKVEVALDREERTIHAWKRVPRIDATAKESSPRGARSSSRSS